MGGRPVVYVADSPINGRGVYAGRTYRPCETVLVLDDSRVVDAEHPLDAASGEFADHCDTLAAGHTVLMPAPERHINSSCDPNSYVTTRSDSRHVVALRPIEARSEITFDYVAAGIGQLAGFPVLTLPKRRDVLRFPGLWSYAPFVCNAAIWGLAVALVARHRRAS